MSDFPNSSRATPDQLASKSTCVVTPEGEEVQVTFNMGTGEVTYQTPCCANKKCCGQSLQKRTHRFPHPLRPVRNISGRAPFPRQHSLLPLLQEFFPSVEELLPGPSPKIPAPLPEVAEFRFRQPKMHGRSRRTLRDRPWPYVKAGRI